MSAKPKIQIPEIFFNETLHIQTNDYWELSQAWHGNSAYKTSITGAFQIANKILAKLNPHRPLAHKIGVLKADIVMYGTKRNMLKVKLSHTPMNQNEQARVTVL